MSRVARTAFTHPVLHSAAFRLPPNKTDQVGDCNANGVADPDMHKVAIFAEAVDGRGPQAEQLRDLADRKKRGA
jgi:hypothetical protein